MLLPLLPLTEPDATDHIVFRGILPKYTQNPGTYSHDIIAQRLGIVLLLINQARLLGIHGVYGTDLCLQRGNPCIQLTNVDGIRQSRSDFLQGLFDLARLLEQFGYTSCQHDNLLFEYALLLFEKGAVHFEKAVELLENVPLHFENGGVRDEKGSFHSDNGEARGEIEQLLFEKAPVHYEKGEALFEKAALLFENVRLLSLLTPAAANNYLLIPQNFGYRNKFYEPVFQRG